MDEVLLCCVCESRKSVTLADKQRTQFLPYNTVVLAHAHIAHQEVCVWRAS